MDCKKFNDECLENKIPAESCFRKLSLKYHPDRKGGNEEKFKVLTNCEDEGKIFKKIKSTTKAEVVKMKSTTKAEKEVAAKTFTEIYIKLERDIFNKNMTINEVISVLEANTALRKQKWQNLSKSNHEDLVKMTAALDFKTIVIHLVIQKLKEKFDIILSLTELLNFYKLSPETQHLNKEDLRKIFVFIDNKKKLSKLQHIFMNKNNEDYTKGDDLVLPWTYANKVPEVIRDDLPLKDVIYYLKDVIFPLEILKFERKISKLKEFFYNLLYMQV